MGRLFREFIHSCLKFLPADRPSAKELLQNPLLSESIPTTPETQKVAKDSIVNIVPLRSESIVNLHDIPQLPPPLSHPKISMTHMSIQTTEPLSWSEYKDSQTERSSRSRVSLDE